MSAGALGRAIDFARRRPEAVLSRILWLHLIVWTVLPILVCPNLQLDLVEDLALGKEWQLGYWKHPPLPWWAADLVYRVTGNVNAVYVLGPLAAVVCMYFVYRLAREMTGPLTALAAVLALEGLHFFNFSVVKFAHDQMQLPFWALTAWFFYRALEDEEPGDWIAAGIFLALAFWSKYAAFALAATLGLFLLLDHDGRKAWRGNGPWLMAAAFLVVLGPNLWWLWKTGFQPFHYVDARAVEARHWYDYLLFPLRWTVGQIGFLIPVLVLLALLIPLRIKRPRPEDNFDARYVLALALGPFLVTTIVAGILGRLPIAMWGYPLWMFAPLAALLWLQPRPQLVRVRRFAVGFVAIFIAVPVLYAAIELFEPLVRDRPKATHFPGRQMAEIITARWREATHSPLVYVGGVSQGHGPGEFAANNLAVYSPDNPHVVVHGDPKLSPWVDRADLARKGAVFVWAQSTAAADLPADLRLAFPKAELQPPLVLPRQTLIPTSTATVHYAFLKPAP